MNNTEILAKWTQLVENGFDYSQYGIKSCNPSIDNVVMYREQLLKYIKDNCPCDKTNVSVKSSNALCNGVDFVTDKQIINQKTDVKIMYPVGTDSDIVQVTRDGCMVTVVVNPLMISTGLKPNILTGDPIQINKKTDTELLISVPVSGKLTSYIWKKGDEVVSSQTSSIFHKENLSLNDSGEYSLTVSDGTNSFTKVIFKLNVSELCISPTIISQPKDLSVTDGEKVTFNVDVNGSQPMHYRWYKNSVEIPNSDSKILSFVVDKDSTGIYSAEVWNCDENKKSIADFTLTVTPKIIPLSFEYAWVNVIPDDLDSILYETVEFNSDDKTITIPLNPVDNKGLICRYPNNESTFTDWYMDTLNYGTIPDQIFLETITLNNYKYIISRNTSISIGIKNNYLKFTK